MEIMYLPDCLRYNFYAHLLSRSSRPVEEVQYFSNQWSKWRFRWLLIELYYLTSFRIVVREEQKYLAELRARVPGALHGVLGDSDGGLNSAKITSYLTKTIAELERIVVALDVMSALIEGEEHDMFIKRDRLERGLEALYEMSMQWSAHKEDIDTLCDATVYTTQVSSSNIPFLRHL